MLMHTTLAADADAVDAISMCKNQATVSLFWKDFGEMGGRALPFSWPRVLDQKSNGQNSTHHKATMGEPSTGLIHQ